MRLSGTSLKAIHNRKHNNKINTKDTKLPLSKYLFQVSNNNTRATSTDIAVFLLSGLNRHLTIGLACQVKNKCNGYPF